ncbi:hypothetical protein [Bacillus sp. FDAARGOS_235]|uniref:hypothetical protein n=1 Tax=Bacillus sp. FDAARGOS_235 TaxID=1839798 RepID=UPI0011A480A7|nr:hypothetical protein [Bacillus sp. FDAARGOS_235]
MIITAKTLSIEYTKGDFFLEQGAPSHEFGKITRTGKSKKENIGSGYNATYISAELLLYIKINEHTYPLSILKQIKAAFNWKKITQKRVELLKETLPETINITNPVKDNSLNNFVISSNSLSEWKQNMLHYL